MTTDNDGLPKIIITHVEVYDHVESIDDAAEDSVKAAENCDNGDNCENIELAVSNEQIKLTEMGEGRKYPKCLKTFQPNLSAQAQKFRIFEKKLSLGVRSLCFQISKLA